MTRIALTLTAVLCFAATASAQHCRGVKVQTVNTHPVCAAPACPAPAHVVPTYYQNTYVGVPVAVYAVPGNPTVALNVYPGQFTVVQAPPPVNVTVVVNGQKAEVKVKEKK